MRFDRSAFQRPPQTLQFQRYKRMIWQSTEGIASDIEAARRVPTAQLEIWPCVHRQQQSHQQRQSPIHHNRSLIHLHTSTRPWPGKVGIHLPATASRVSDSVRLGSQGRLDACDHGLTGGRGCLDDGGRIRGRVGERQVGDDRHSGDAHAQGMQRDGLHDG